MVGLPEVTAELVMLAAVVRSLKPAVCAKLMSDIAGPLSAPNVVRLRPRGAAFGEAEAFARRLCETCPSRSRCPGPLA